MCENENERRMLLNFDFYSPRSKTLNVRSFFPLNSSSHPTIHYGHTVEWNFYYMSVIFSSHITMHRKFKIGNKCKTHNHKLHKEKQKLMRICIFCSFITETHKHYIFRRNKRHVISLFQISQIVHIFISKLETWIKKHPLFFPSAKHIKATALTKENSHVSSQSWTSPEVSLWANIVNSDDTSFFFSPPSFPQIAFPCLSSPPSFIVCTYSITSSHSSMKYQQKVMSLSVAVAGTRDGDKK